MPPSFEGEGYGYNSTMGFHMIRLTKSFLRDESAAAAAEYAMILAVVAIAIFTAASTLGTTIATAISAATTDV